MLRTSFGCASTKAARIRGWLLAYMLSEKRQMTGQANVNSTKLKALPIALPPLAKQREIVAELDALQVQADQVRSLQAETAAELDTLLPALLDRAFKAQL